MLASVSPPTQTLFASFWAAVDGRALSGLDRTTACGAFLSSVLECAVYVARRILADDDEALLLLAEDEEDAGLSTARALVCEQVRRAWEEIEARRLRTDEGLAAECFARTLNSANQVDQGTFVQLFADPLGIRIPKRLRSGLIP